MSGPTRDNPLGQPLSDPLEVALRKLVDDRIARAWVGRHTPDFANTPDTVLCLELIARGWVVYKPRHPEHPET